MKKRLTTLAVLVIVIALAVTGFAGCQPAGGQSTVVEPAADTADDTAADDQDKTRQLMGKLNAVFEEWIRDEPSEWLCTNRRWPKDATPPIKP